MTQHYWIDCAVFVCCQMFSKLKCFCPCVRLRRGNGDDMAVIEDGAVDGDGSDPAAADAAAGDEVANAF